MDWPALSASPTLQPKALVVRDSDSHPCKCSFGEFHGMTPFILLFLCGGHWNSVIALRLLYAVLSDPYGPSFYNSVSDMHNR
jgi:hypothetical protein